MQTIEPELGGTRDGAAAHSPMPTQLLRASRPNPISIVAFDRAAGEDIHLTFTHNRDGGPPIHRNGIDPAWMEVIDGEPGQRTTNVAAQRRGSWLIQEDLRDEEIASVTAELDAAVRAGNTADAALLNRALKELRLPLTDPLAVLAHDTFFLSRVPRTQIVGHQGCGDLSMNPGRVAHLNGPLTRVPGVPDFIALSGEPVERTVYSALVKWKPTDGGARRVTIEDVRFRRPAVAGSTNKRVWVRDRDQWLPRGDSMEFAVSAPEVIRAGELTPTVTIVDQFSDVRHLFKLPNLNPRGPLYPGEVSPAQGVWQARWYFGRRCVADVWFGVTAFDDPLRGPNRCRAALAGPVVLENEPGASPDQLAGAFERSGYDPQPNPNAALKPGEWRFVTLVESQTHIEVYLLRNPYWGWTMIGLDKSGNEIVALAATGAPGVSGWTLEEAADQLRRMGAYNALVIDEGYDAFQKVREPWGWLTETVPRRRCRMRATFVFARDLNRNPSLVMP